jgi:hypothetical protein
VTAGNEPAVAKQQILWGNMLLYIKNGRADGLFRYLSRFSKIENLDIPYP